MMVRPLIFKPTQRPLFSLWPVPNRITSYNVCYTKLLRVARAAAKFGDKVVYKEHRIKEAEGVQMMVSLGVQNLPTIVMDA